MLCYRRVSHWWNTETILDKNKRKKLAYKIVVQLALDLSRGLSYLHSKKIVHRDVKSENMFLDGNRNLKIVDFGVAHVEVMNPSDMTGETRTLEYMAPKVLDGKPYNRTWDVYSFGIFLWEIYCCGIDEGVVNLIKDGDRRYLCYGSEPLNK
ncbi:unnamed protein product [Vicia faba]|uniref:Protein kinase domain-containing protein n=1 Tax=Vicia faba TaxID=3906 RepID=A0AAV0ZFK0_VICFA|nr:unnamed protein product [Vicia faba]